MTPEHLASFVWGFALFCLAVAGVIGALFVLYCLHVARRLPDESDDQ